MTAAQLTAQPDIGTQAVNQPAVAPARMAAPKAKDIAEKQLEDGGVWHRAGQGIKGVDGREPAPGRGSSPAARSGRPA